MTDENTAEAEDFDEIFKDESTETEDESSEESNEEVKGETDETETQESDETAPPADKEPEPKLVPIAALHDKARRVQELREENEKLKSQIPQTEQKPDMYEDPEGYEAYVEAKVEEKFLAKKIEDENERLEKSRNNMIENHTDYLDVEDVFMFRSRNNKTLVDEMLASVDPAKFAYEKGKAYLKEQKDALRAELLAENSEDIDKPTSKKTVAPSLASATDAGSNTVQVEKEESMDEMFGDQKY